jgi:hypothetical protein
LGINTGSGTTLAITNSSTFIATAGTVLGANRGTIAVSDSATLQIGGTFNNSGEIGLSASGDPTSLLISRDTTLKGGGTVLMTDSSGNTIGSNTNSYPGPMLTNVDNIIAGAGTIGNNSYPGYYIGRAIINGSGQVEFGAASSNGTQFAAGSTGELILDDSHYTGTVSGFGTNTTQSIDRTDIDFATATKSDANETLTVKDGVGDIAHIKFSGTHTLASFNLQDDGQGGVLITDPPVPSKTQIGDVALFGNYIASMFASASPGHGAITTLRMDAPLPQLLSLPHA